MKLFFARTESGTIYLSDGQFVRIISPGLDPYTINVIQAKVIDRDTFPEEVTQEMFWKLLQAGEPSDIPVVGKSFLVSGFSDWRLSTDMVEVIELEEPEESEMMLTWRERILELHG